MLPKQNRLTKDSEIKTVFKKSKKVSSDFFEIYLHNRASLHKNELPRFSFVISTKVHKHAVKRNMLKRQLRAAINIILKDGIRSLLGKDFVIRVKPGYFEISNRYSATELITELKGLLSV